MPGVELVDEHEVRPTDFVAAELIAWCLDGRTKLIQCGIVLSNIPPELTAAQLLELAPDVVTGVRRLRYRRATMGSKRASDPYTIGWEDRPMQRKPMQRIVFQRLALDMRRQMYKKIKALKMS